MPPLWQNLILILLLKGCTYIQYLKTANKLSLALQKMDPCLHLVPMYHCIPRFALYPCSGSYSWMADHSQYYLMSQWVFHLAMLHQKYAKWTDNSVISLNNNRAIDSNDIWIWFDLQWSNRDVFDVWLSDKSFMEGF